MNQNVSVQLVYKETMLVIVTSSTFMIPLASQSWLIKNFFSGVWYVNIFLMALIWKGLILSVCKQFVDVRFYMTDILLL